MAGTLDDLAALSGVSRATVSRVINGGSVSEATRDRVMAVLERTGYRPNLAARTLASGRSGVVGVVMHVESARAVPGSVLLPAAAGHERRAVRDGDRHDAVAREPLEAGDPRPDPGHGTPRGRDRHRVQPGGPAGGRAADVIRSPRCSSVTAAPIAPRATSTSITSRPPTACTSHLVDAGRRRIGHITGRRGTVAGEDRIIGVSSARWTGRGLSTDGLIVDGDFRKASGASAALELLDRGVDAIFCANDATAAGALESIHARGLRVPEDVALAGFDDLEFAAADGSTADDGPSGDPGARGGGRPRALTAPGRSRRRSAPRDPADGADDPAFHRGRCAGSVKDHRERRRDVKQAMGLVSYLCMNVQGSADAREGASRASI